MHLHVTSQTFRRFQGLFLQIMLLGCIPAMGQDNVNQGTIGPIPYARKTTKDSKIDNDINRHIEPGSSYYSIRVAGAYVSVPKKNAIKNLFDRAKQVTMTSSAKVVGDPSLPSTQSINWVTDIEPGKSKELGSKTFLVNYLPATGTSVAVTVEYRVLSESPAAETLKKMSSFINDQKQPLGVSLGLSAGQAAGLGTVGAVSGIASQMISTFFPTETDKTTLKFNAEWPLRNNLKSSYYFVLGAYDKQSLPSAADIAKLRVEPVGDALSGQAKLLDEDGSDYTDSSYVIFEVFYYSDIDKAFNPEWLDIFDEAVNQANFFKQTRPNPTAEQKNEAFAVCEGLVKQGKAFADKDARYLASERRKHWEKAINACRGSILGIATP